MKIKKVEIQGFRAYKYKKDGTFDFTIDGNKPSNFVAICAPNGFGKSSFYDAVEWAITNHIDRLGGEHNRHNHEHAAKSTKQKGVAQKILRNKDVAKDIPTRVTVFTTLTEPFDRELKLIRSDSRDLRIGENKGRENGYFRKVVLSQDEIERFLREAKPQDRYKRFMDSFGGDADVIRQELTALINDNKAMLAELEKERDGIQEQLREPVDASVFERFNGIASELNADSESIPLINKDFSADSEHHILSALVTRAHELKRLREACGLVRDSLIERLSWLPEVQLNLNLIAAKQPALAILIKGVSDAQRYQGLLDSHSKMLSGLQAVSRQMEELIDMDRLALVFLRTESDIIAGIERRVLLTKDHVDKTALLYSLEKSAIRKIEELAALDSRSLFLRTSVQNCDPIYSEIQILQLRLVSLGAQIAEKEVALILDKALRGNIEAELVKIAALDITIQSLLTTDVSALNFDKIKLQQLNDFSEELGILEEHDKSIERTQETLIEQMGVRERLMAMGLQYLSLWPTSTCPLCQKSHDSASDLKEKVESVDLLSNLSRENIRKLEVSATRKFDLKRGMDAVAQEALELQMQRLSELRKNLNELGREISKTEHDTSKLSAEKQAVEGQIASQQSSVFGLAKEDLISRAEIELRALDEKRNEYLSQQKEVRQQIDAQEALLIDADSSIRAQNLQLDAMSSDPNCVKVGAYLKDHGLLSAELKAHCAQKLSDLERQRDEHKAEISKSVDESIALRDDMVRNGTWVDFATLASQKEQVGVQIATSESVVATFFDSIDRAIGLQDKKLPAEVKQNISKAIDIHILEHQGLEIKLNKMELLSELLKAAKPYMTNLRLKETLANVEKNLLQRNRADKALTDERNLVVAELKRLIKAFFYEDLIDSIYRKIDPHPSLKKVEFRPDFDTSDRPGLNIVLSDEAGDSVSPILYFSAAQLNILSLSVFLAGALHAKDDHGTPLDVIMIDDPIQSMDSINVLATIDLLRSISVRFDKQIIVSTHDENFFGLLQRKIPSEVLDSKFLKLEKFGVVIPVQPLTN
jgi:exonuclease SbcC